MRGGIRPAVAVPRRPEAGKRRVSALLSLLVVAPLHEPCGHRRVSAAAIAALGEPGLTTTFGNLLRKGKTPPKWRKSSIGAANLRSTAAEDVSCDHEEQSVPGARGTHVCLRARLSRFRGRPDSDTQAGPRVDGQELEIQLLRSRRPPVADPEACRGQALEGTAGRPDASRERPLGPVGSF